MAVILRDYQSNGIDSIAKLFSNGTRRIIYQNATGAGKTITFSAMSERYLKSFPNKKILIAVHRQELLKQTRNTLYNHFNLLFEPIDADTKHITANTKGYVAMVETLFNRLKKNPYLAKSIGMLILDEAHIGNFKKIYDSFPEALIVGFTATPVSSSKKDPLKNYFDEIVCGPQIGELIQMNSLCQNETYSIRNINRKNLSVKRGEFDNTEMGREYSKSKHVHNVVEAYKRLGQNKKTMVFNCNVEHSKLVNDAFLEAGYNSRHLDGTETDAKRKETLLWFKNNDDAILNNIGVLTTGFDEPSVINIIVNRSTMSLPLWLQMTGRGSRPSTGKEFFRIIDMGGNAVSHGDWSIDRDWTGMFHNPDKPSDAGGVAPIKVCKGCEAIIPAQAVTCAFCGHVHERVIEYDTVLPEFELLVSRMDVKSMVEDSQRNGYKEWKVFFELLNKAVTVLKYRGVLTDEGIDKAYILFEDKVKEWKHELGKNFTKYDKEFARKKFLEEVFKIYGDRK